MYQKMVCSITRIVWSAIGILLVISFLLKYPDIQKFYRGYCFKEHKYKYKERVDYVLSLMIEKIIQDDKSARIKMMKVQGLTQKEIEKKLHSLEPIYKREQEKFVYYCSTEALPEYSVIAQKLYSANEYETNLEPWNDRNYFKTLRMPNCEIEQFSDKSLSMEVHYLLISYSFDEKSFAFFNEIPYISYRKNKEGRWHFVKKTNIFIQDNAENQENWCSRQYSLDDLHYGLSFDESTVVDDENKYIKLNEKRRK